ncbi:hypothetical protein [Actinoplanes sp. NPDC049599]|uniref:hypothetical protein n=1 Tax=Actinoplanes sp. NPDC049599 TaxID=3363903 RepID=UPI0037A2AABD
MSDWARFLSEVSWFVQPGDRVSVGEPQPWDRGPVDGLPELSTLLAAATRTPLSVGGADYELLAWGPADARRGWLCRPPGDGGDRVPELHRRFWTVCGGVVERFRDPGGWWMNQNEVLTAAATRENFGEMLAAYSWIWEDENLRVPIDPADYYAAAVEANGNLTLAHREDGRLLLFAPDHGFDRVTPLAGCPPFSLLTFDDLPDLAAWIEVCARAWATPDAPAPPT